MLRHIGKKFIHWFSLFLGVVIAVFIVALVVMRTDFFSSNITRMLSRNLFHRSNFSLHIGRFEGNIVSGVDARDIFIRYSSREGSFDFLRADEIRLRYNLIDLLGGKISLDTVEVVNPHVWIKPDTTGRFIFPALDSRSSGTSGFLIGFIKIRDGQIIFQGRKKADFISDIRIEGSIVSKGDSVLFDVFKGSGEEIARGVRLNGMSGRLGLVDRKGGVIFNRKRERRVFADSLYLTLEESNVVLDGEYMPDSMFFDVSILIGNLDLEELFKIMRVKRDVFGELSGRLRVSGTPDSLDVSSRLSGFVRGYEFDGMNLETTLRNGKPGEITLSGNLNGAEISGKGRFVSERPSSVSLELDFKDLDISKNFLPFTDVPRSSLSGTMGLLYKLDRGHAIFRMKTGKGYVGRVMFDVAIFNGALSGDSLKVDELFILHDSHNLKASGLYVLNRGGRLYMDMNCNRDDVFFDLLGIEEYRANLVANGVWEGNLQDYTVYASGHFTDLSYHAAEIPAGEVKVAVRRKGQYRVQVDISSDTCTVLGETFSKMNLSLEYLDGLTDIRKLRLESSGKTISLSAGIRSSGDTLVVDISGADAFFLGEQWRSGGEFRVSMVDSLVLFKDAQLHSRRGAIYLNGSLDRKRKSIDAGLVFERLDLSLLRDSSLTGLGFSGKCAGILKAEGSLEDPALSLRLRARGVAFDTFLVDSVVVDAGYREGVYSLDTLLASANGGSLKMKGEIAGSTLRGFMSNVDSSFTLLTGRVEIECSGLDLRPVGKFVRSFPISEGLLSGSIVIWDSLVHPEIEMKGYIENMKAVAFDIPRLSFNSGLIEDTLSVNGRIHLGKDHFGTFDGRIPLKRVERFYGLDRRGDLVFKMEFPKGDFSDLARTTERFAEAAGSFSMTFRVEGTVRSPRLYGEFNLRDVSFRLAGMEENFRGVNGRVLLNDTVVTVQALRGLEGKKGSFRGSGSMILRSWKPVDYDLDLEFDRFFLGSLPDVVAIVSGKLHIGGTESDGKIVPEITGKISANSAELYYELGASTGGVSRATLSPPAWKASVDIEIPGNVWIKTPDARIELEGAVTLYHDNRGNYLRGELELIRGWYNVYNSKFKITQGRLNFATAEGFRPIIDIDAETTDPDGRKIFLTIRWHQDDIEPRLSLRHEDPGYSETDIWKMLGGGVVQSPGGEGVSWDAVSTAQNIAANYLERLLNSQMQGVTVEVETRGEIGNPIGGRFPEREMVIAIGKYLSQGLYVKYTQGLSITSAREIDAEYRISRFFLLRSEIIRYSEKVLQGKSGGSTDEVNLDIRLRLEFW